VSENTITQTCKLRNGKLIIEFRFVKLDLSFGDSKHASSWEQQTQEQKPPRSPPFWTEQILWKRYRPLANSVWSIVPSATLSMKNTANEISPKQGSWKDSCCFVLNLKNGRNDLPPPLSYLVGSPPVCKCVPTLMQLTSCIFCNGSRTPTRVFR